MKFKFVTTIQLVFFLLFMGYNIESYAKETNVAETGDYYEQETSVEQARKYAEDCLTEYSKNVDKEDFFYYENTNSLKLGEPYIIYNTTESTQIKLFNFPVYDIKTNEIIYIIEAFQVDNKDEYICNISDNYVEILNQLDYISNSNRIIAYLVHNTVFFDNTDYVFDGEKTYYDIVNEDVWSDSEKLFLEKSFDEKKLLIQERMSNMESFQSPNITKEESLNRIVSGSLTLYKPQGQYGYNMCWASAVATVNNYIHTNVITGYNVCSRMGRGYNAGGTVLDEQDALSLYGITYNYIRFDKGTPLFSWFHLTNNINNSYPIIINAFNSNVGHAVTVYGYSGSSSTSNNVKIWNSNANNGNGGYSTFSWSNGYISDGTNVYEFGNALSKY